MMVKSLVWAAVVLSLFVVREVSADTCQFARAPVTRFNSNELLYQVWSEPGRAVLWSQALSLPPAILSYQSWAAKRTNTDPFFLLRRQREFFAKFGHVKNHDLIIDGRVGQISPMGCLESLLLNAHTLHIPLEKTPTEFMAYILRRQRSGFPEIKVHFISGNSLAAPAESFVLPNVELDLREGWTFFAHLHNHPFFFGNPGGDIAGTLVPSGDEKSVDVATFLRYREHLGLRQAWITNGFHTIRIQADELDLLR